VFAQRTGLLEHADLQLSQSPSTLVLPGDQSAELDCPGQSGGATADEQHVHRDGLVVRLVLDYETLQR
jgi:hypothetical protein